MLTATDFIRYPEALPPLDRVVSDEKLRQHITDQIHEACGRLMRLDELKLCDIQVGVTEKQVVLNGTVECSRLRRLAESIARFTPDVVSVTNQIQVRVATTFGSPSAKHHHFHPTITKGEL